MEDLIKEELCEKFEEDKANWFVTPSASQGKRTPGLFKVEQGIRPLDFVLNPTALNTLHRSLIQGK